MAGACALRYAMEKEGLSGTVKLIEAPAEEIGQGKAYLAKDGVFDDVDMTLMWHPGPTDLDFPRFPSWLLSARSLISTERPPMRRFPGRDAAPSMPYSL